VEKRKIPRPPPRIEPPNSNRPARSQSLYRLSYPSSHDDDDDDDDDDHSLCCTGVTVILPWPENDYFIHKTKHSVPFSFPYINSGGLKFGPTATFSLFCRSTTQKWIGGGSEKGWDYGSQ
jgi:hypothetical protein